MTRLISREASLRRAGVVAYHDNERGFGKIRADVEPDGTEIEYFFHVTACRGYPTGGNTFHLLVAGTPVTFAARETDKGPRAFEVRVDQAAETQACDAADARGNR